MGIAVAHIALWTNRLEELRDFYVRYFDGESGPVYRNPAKGFESFFRPFRRRRRVGTDAEDGYPGFGRRRAYRLLSRRVRRRQPRSGVQPDRTVAAGRVSDRRRTEADRGRILRERRLRPRRQPDRDRSLTGYLEIWTARNCVSFIWVPPILRWPRCGDWWKRVITSSAS